MEVGEAASWLRLFNNEARTPSPVSRCKKEPERFCGDAKEAACGVDVVRRERRSISYLQARRLGACMPLVHDFSVQM